MEVKYINYFFSNEGTRNEVRMRVVNLFSMENHGYGKGDKASRYIYYVEKLLCGNRIYLQRPAYLHSGFDFIICIENFNFSATGKRHRNYPTHDDILNDIINKKNIFPLEYQKLFNVLYNVYSCNNIDDLKIDDINMQVGFPIDLIIKTIKWFFIEQDIRYWNYSGRDMLWNRIATI